MMKPIILAILMTQAKAQRYVDDSMEFNTLMDTWGRNTDINYNNYPPFNNGARHIAPRTYLPPHTTIQPNILIVRVDKNTTIKYTLSRRKDRLANVTTILGIDEANQCEDMEYKMTTQPIIQSQELRGDIITKSIFQPQVRNLLCNAIEVLEHSTLRETANTLLNGIQHLAKRFAFNRARLTLLKIMITITKTRATMKHPTLLYKINSFTNFLNMKLPPPMSETQEIKEKLATYAAIKTLLRKLRTTVWKGPVRHQKTSFRKMYAQIDEMIEEEDKTTPNGSSAKEKMEDLEKQMQAAYRNVDITEIDVNTILDLVTTH